MNAAPPGHERTRELLALLRKRFDDHPKRNRDIQWSDVEHRLLTETRKLAALDAMEQSGGEPQVLTVDENTGEFLFFDTSAESPALRRSLCYDRPALDARKENKPAGSAVEMAAQMGCELLTAESYADLQLFGEFDLKTSSWLRTPEEVRKHGGALFGDRRYGRVFVYHNGAGSYYAARGFRTMLRV